MILPPKKMPTRSLQALLCALVALSHPLVAQQPSAAAQAGFLALLFTPVGALPAIVQGSRAHGTGKAALHARYGMYRFSGADTRFANVGLGGRVRVGKRLAVGATVGSRSCSGCEGLRMGGVEADLHLWEKTATEDGGDATLDLQLSGGIGKPNEAEFSAASLAAALPMAVTLRQSWQGSVTLFFAPMLGYGRLQDDAGTILGSPGSGAATKILLSAGGNIVLDRGLGIHTAVHRVVVDDSPTQIGFGLSYAFGRAPR